ncbi:MAG TPA: hypothetical protein VEJ36_06625 [Nitrososphaerales archaeon]|nr:hypothetical protein [Nitrososphaerales archaeon]
MTLVSGILLGLHILSAASWFGAALLFATVVGPTIGDFTPSTSGEVVVKMLPKYLRFMAVFTVLTPILGVVTAYTSSGGSLSAFAPTSSYGMFISAGALLSLITWVVVFGVIYPTGRKIIKITAEVVKNQTPQPPGLPRLAMRLKISSGVGLALLIAILVCMIAAAQ